MSRMSTRELYQAYVRAERDYIDAAAHGHDLESRRFSEQAQSLGDRLERRGVVGDDQ